MAANLAPPGVFAVVLLAQLILSGNCVSGLRLPFDIWGKSSQPVRIATEYKQHTQPGSVVLDDNGHYLFVPDAHLPEAVAWGSYLDGAHTVSNFGQLRITTSPDFSDSQQTFAAGFLEGWLTAHRIQQNFDNLYEYFIKGMNASLNEPLEWIHKQDNWLRATCEDSYGFSMPPGAAAPSRYYYREKSSSGGTQKQEGKVHHGHHHGKNHHGKKPEDNRRFWEAVCLTVRQFDGLIAGYKARADADISLPPMSYEDFLFMENNADLYDVIDMMDPAQRPSWDGSDDEDDDDDQTTLSVDKNGFLSRWGKDPDALFRQIALAGKCSALVKLAADLSDIYVGHATWDSYTAMLRIYKHYSFNLTALQPAAQRISFSSYPGEVFSDDDFFILSSKIVVTQTTNKIFNDELFDALTPSSVPSWCRVRAANWLANSGEEWANLLDTENSGTYNNQYIVVDLKRFVPGDDPAPGLLWIVEQIPGRIVAADATEMLALGYWPSYNVPYFPEIYNASGYPDFISKLEKYGQHFGRTTHWLSYTRTPRAKIFRRDQAGIDSLEGMKMVMRGNDWRQDPLSEGHPICAVCGRGDLDPSAPEARGCYDTKVTSYRLALEMTSEAVNGPTTGGGVGGNWWNKLPTFDWDVIETRLQTSLVHEGQPKRFNFKFERQSPFDGEYDVFA